MLERSNNLIHIPNTKLSTAIIKNYDSGDPSFSVKIPLGVSYDSDLDHVGKVVMEVATSITTLPTWSKSESYDTPSGIFTEKLGSPLS